MADVNRGVGIAAFSLCAVALTWPIWVAGVPPIFSDTGIYLSGGAEAVRSVLGIKLEMGSVTGGMAPAPVTAGAVAPAEPVEVSAAPQQLADPHVSMARSVYYAVFLAVTTAVGGPVLPALLQVIALALTLWCVLQALFGDRSMLPALMLLVLCLCTPLGYVAPLLMPDIFAPIAIIAVAALFAFPDRLTLPMRLWLAAMLAAAGAVHNAHIALIAAMVILAVPIGWLAGQRVRPGLALGGMAVAVAILGNVVFIEAVKAKYGYAPRPLPMVAASLIADGTGAALLREDCAADPDAWVYCAHKYEDVPETDQYLWSTDVGYGVYLFADPETQNRMSDEQGAFAIAVITAYPVEQVQAWFSRMERQLGHIWLPYYTVMDAYADVFTDRRLADEDVLVDLQRLQGVLPPLEKMTVASIVLSLPIILCWIAFSRRINHLPHDPADGPHPTAVAAFLVIVLAGVLVNAALMGAFSQPQDRYQSRVIWLVPFVAFVCVPMLARLTTAFRRQSV